MCMCLSVCVCTRVCVCIWALDLCFNFSTEGRYSWECSRDCVLEGHFFSFLDRGEVITKAGAKEEVVYADIGEPLQNRQHLVETHTDQRVIYRRKTHTSSM